MNTGRVRDNEQQYDNWLQRAQSGDADAVVTEVSKALTRGHHDNEAHTWGLYLISVAHAAAGRLVEASAAAQQAMQLARASQSLGLLALTLSNTALLAVETDGLSAGLKQYQQAERLLARALPADLAHPAWVAALIDMWVVAGRMGMRIRAYELGRLCQDLPAGAATRFESKAIAINAAEDRLWAALRPVRQPPFRVDRSLLTEARELARQAELASPGPGDLAHDAEMWDAIVAAWIGDAAHAAEVLDSLVTNTRLHLLNTLEPAVRASRLRALRRAGSTAALVTACVDESDAVTRLSNVPHAPEELASLLWERALCSTPELSRPGSQAAQLAQFWEHHAIEHEGIVRDLLGLYVERGQLEEQRGALTDLTMLDELTGVLNRRGLGPHLARAAADDDGVAWAAVLIDIDGFKAMNDTVGHMVADRMLQMVAEALRLASRAGDKVARIGGDEFVVLAVLSSDETDVTALGARIRDSVRRYDPTSAVRVSVGVAVRTHAVEPEVWLHSADQAMYAAKRAGGDRVSQAPPL